MGWPLPSLDRAPREHIDGICDQGGEQSSDESIRYLCLHFQQALVPFTLKYSP
jgi:hypothetical protein